MGECPIKRGRTLKELDTYVSTCPDCGLFVDDCRCRGPFVWYPEKGYGQLPTAWPFDYPRSYFENFAQISENKRGEALNDQRIEFVAKWWQGPVLDIGIGSGAFIKQRAEETWGFDVAETPKEWLIERELWRDPFDERVKAATLWDSLEHMEHPGSLLERITHAVFISTPIYESVEHVLRSRHFKPREHLWYFTERGLIGWMAEQGWQLLERSRMEESFGREGIGTYAFAREL